MPNWKKLIVSGSDATLNSLNVTNNISASNLYVKDEIIHHGDTNTKIKFTSDKIAFKAAGDNFIELSDDLITLNKNVSASGDFLVNHITASGDISGSGTGSFTDGRFTGNVGIGTTSPTQKLEVNGTVLFSTLPNNNGRLCLGSVNTNLFSGASNGHLFISTNGSTRMTILNGGDVGIGTTSPLHPLHVVGIISGSNLSGTNTGDQNLSNLAITGSNVLFGNITASGDISASGNFQSNEITGSNLAIGASYNSLPSSGYTGITSRFDGGSYFNIKQEALKTFGIKHEAVGDDILQIDTDPNHFLLDPTGNIELKVGLGVVSPSASLDIVGNIQVSSHITASGAISASGLTVGDDINLSTSGRIYFNGAGGSSNIHHNQTNGSLDLNAGEIFLNSVSRTNIFDTSNPTLRFYTNDGSVGSGDSIGNIHFQTADANDVKSFELQVKATANHDDGSNASAEAIFKVATGDSENEILRLSGNTASVTGNISASGDLLANNITASGDINAAGSTTLGDSISDTHTFTGSVNISGSVTVPDNARVILGSGNDFNIYHDGTTSRIQNTTGDVRFINFQDDGDIIFQSDDGSSGVTEYFRLDGGQTQTIFSENAQWQDGKRVKLGSGGDLQIQHTGTIGSIENQTGDLVIKTTQDDGDIIFHSDDGLGGTNEYLRIDGGTQQIVYNSESLHLDNVKAKFGTGGDLSIYHDGSNSYIDETGVGSLFIKSAGAIRLQSDTGENMIYAVNDGAVNLYHNNVNKLQTNAAGARVSGDLEVTGTIQAEAIHTTITSSSILLQSGSTRFGDTIDDTHVITGSLSTTGSLTVAGLVGIGTTTPIFDLDVRGDIGTDRYIRHNGDSNTYFGFGGADTIQFNTNGNERLRINSSGNIGIGTTTPAEKLTVEGNITGSGTGSFEGGIRIGGTNGRTAEIVDSFGEKILFELNDLKVCSKHINSEFGVFARSTGTTRQMGIDGSSTCMGLYTAGHERVSISQVGDMVVTGSIAGTHITSSGNITATGGISAAHITASGDISSSGNLTANGITIETGGPVLTLKDTTDDDDHRIIFRDESNNIVHEIRTSDNTGGLGGDMFLVKSVESKPLGLGTNDTLRLTIEAAGNVGIGTASPGEKLEVVGNISASGDITGVTGSFDGLKVSSVVNAGSDTDKFLVVDSHGNVDFRTGEEVKSDIGAVGSSGVSDAGGAACQIAVWSSASAISGSTNFVYDTTENKLEVVGDIITTGSLDVTGSATIFGNTQDVLTVKSSLANHGFLKIHHTSHVARLRLTSNTGTFEVIGDGVGGFISGGGYIFNAPTARDTFHFAVNNTPKMTLEAGRLGIGEGYLHSNLPSEMLDVSGSAIIRGHITASGNISATAGALSVTADGSNAATLTESGDGDFTIAAVDDIRLDAGGGDIVLRDNGSEFARFSNGSQNLQIRNITQDKNIIFKGNDGGSTITAMTLDMSEGGRLGIGTTLPKAKLHISGSGSTESAIRQTRAGVKIWDQAIDSSGRLQWGYRSTEAGSRTTTFTLDDNNNVGIGIGAPTALLHVSSSGTTKAIIEGTNGSQILRLKRTDQNKYFDLSLEGNDLRFNPGTLDNSQNVLFGVNAGSQKVASRVGIGHPDPAAELHVSGSIIVTGAISSSGNITGVSGSFDYVKTNRLQVGAAGGTDVLSIDGGDLQLENGKQITFADIGDGNTGRVKITGNEDTDIISMHVDNSNTKNITLTTTGVGIGTLTPSEKLTVAGNISGSGTGSFNSIAIPGTTTDYYIGGSGGGAATNDLRIGTQTTANSVALEIYHSSNPVSLGIDYSGGAGLAYIESAHPSYDVNTHMLFKPGGSETWRIGSHGSNASNKFEIKPAAAGNDFVIADNTGASILGIDTSTKLTTFAGDISGSGTGSFSDGRFTGKIGIGADPAYALHVKSDSGGALSEVAHFVGGGSTDDKSQISIGGNTSSALVSFGFRNTGLGFGYIANASDVEVITIDGGNKRLGIGTTVPTSKLTVHGDARITGSLQITGSGTFLNDITLSSGNINIDNNGATIFDNTNNNNAWYIRNGGSNAATLQFGLGASPGSNIKHTFSGDGNVSFAADMAVGGDLTVEGIVTAQEFHTEFVSSSIVYQSGSTQFGDTRDDTHNFTGTVNINSGSINIEPEPMISSSNNAAIHVVHGVKDKNAYHILVENTGSQDAFKLYSDTNQHVDLALSQAGSQKVGLNTYWPGMINNSGYSSRGGLVLGAGNYTSERYGLKVNDTGAGASGSMNVADTLYVSGARVGVGISNPTQNLDVRGSAIIAGSSPNAPVGSSATLEVYENGSTANLVIHQDNSSASGTFSQLKFRNGGNDTLLKVPTSGQGLIIDTENKSNAFVLDTSGKITSHITASGNISASGEGYFSKIGIGTTTPSNQLHVYNTGNGEALIERASGAQILLQAQASVGVVGTNSNHDLDLKTNGSTRIKVENTGNVGIGTTSPTEKLTVAGDISGSGNLDIDGNLTASLDAIFQSNAAVASKLGVGVTSAHGSFGFYNQNNAYFNGHVTINDSLAVDAGSITASGDISGSGTGSFTGGGIFGSRVGIGTTSPTYKLDVESSDEIVASFVSTDNKAAIAISDNDTSGYVSAENSRISIGPQVGLHANNLNILTSNSNVGIGTSSPSEKLEVVGNISASGQINANTLNLQNISNADSDVDKFLVLDADGNVDFRTGANVLSDIGAVGSSGVTDDGGGACQVAVWSSASAISGSNELFFNVATNRLGIGEDSIDAKLHISDGTTPNIKFERPGQAAWRMGVTGTSFVFDNANDNLSVPRLSIDTNGIVSASGDLGIGGILTFHTNNHNVLIGNSNINSGSATGLRNIVLSADTNTGKSLNDGSDNVLLGASVGRCITDGSCNIGIGQRAICCVTTSNCNVAIGHFSLQKLTTGDGKNTAVGALAGCNLSTGRLNTLIGCGAGRKITTGECNKVLGDGAGSNILTGNKNVVIGNAGPSGSACCTVIIGQSAGGNTVPSNSVFIGPSAGNKVAGINNTAVGSSALKLLDCDGSVSTNNTAIGEDAMCGAKCTSCNTAVGTDALRLHTSGSHNTAIGNKAAQNAFQNLGSLDRYNTAIGATAMSNVHTGSNNTALGYCAGKRSAASADISCASNSIFIGYAACSLNTTSDNQIVIGASAVGLGDDTLVLGNDSNNLTKLTGRIVAGVDAVSTVGGTAKVTINVGSGTSSPISFVNGTTDGMYIRRYGSSGQFQLQTTVSGGNTGNLSLQSYGGSVGIGTTAPSSTLEVSGSTHLGGGIGDTHSITGSINLTGSINIVDNGEIKFGNSGDLNIKHDGSNSKLENYTGHLNIVQEAADKDIVFLNDDGSGNTTEYFRLDGDTLDARFSKNVLLFDDVELKIGAGNDLNIRHNGSNSFIQNQTGDLFIQTANTSGDIRFRSGSTEYFRVDSSHSVTRFVKEVLLEDGVQLQLGTGNDLQLQHNGSNALFTNNTGNLLFTQNTNDGDIIFLSDNGSGGVENYIQIDGSEGRTLFNKHIRINDDVQFQIGASNDAYITHNGTDTFIVNGNGDLKIQTATATGDINFLSGSTEFFRLDGGADKVIFSKGIRLIDNQRLDVGGATDGRFFHDGTDTQLVTITGDLLIKNNNDDGDIKFQSDDGLGGTNEYLRIDGGTQQVIFSSESLHSDNVKAKFGTGGDLQIFHTGDNSFIDDNGTGDLYIQTNGTNMFLRDKSSGNTFIAMNTGTADVSLKQGGNTKLTTTSDGAKITGNLEVTGTVQAEQFNTTIVSSSVVFQSGSTQFGDSTDDIHTFTGSLLLTGSQTIDLGERDIVFTTLSGHPKIDAEGTLFLDATGQVQLQTDLIPDSDGNHKIGQSNRYFNSLFVDRANIGNDPSHQHIISGSLNLTGSITLADNAAAQFGAGQDLHILSDGTNGIIKTGTATGDIKFQSGSTEFFRLDGGAATTIFSKNIALGDNVIAQFGNADDLQIYHDGSNTHMVNLTGNLRIRQFADNSDITFESDDGLGGTNEYFRVDGGEQKVIFASASKHNDSVQIELGDSGDFNMFHDGTDVTLQNFTGDFNIVNKANDKDIIFKSDDGSGGVAEYFRLDGGLGYSVSSQHIQIIDGKAVYYGSGNDLGIYHSSNNSYIENITGDLFIQTGNATGDIRFRSGSTEFFRLDGGIASLVASKDLLMGNDGDGGKIKFGASQDLIIGHDGSHSVIQANGTGNLIIKQDTADADIVFKSDNGSGGSAEYLRLDGGTQKVIFSSQSLHSDNVKAKFGTGGDLEIYNDGTNSFIKEAVDNSGTFTIESKLDLHLKSATGNTLLRGGAGEPTLIADTNGVTRVKLYHNDGNGGQNIHLIGAVSASGHVSGSALHTSGTVTGLSGSFKNVSILDSIHSHNPRLTVGRDSGQHISVSVTDNDNTITATQDSDSNGAHKFILDRVFGGNGNNDFIIQKGGSDQFTINTNGHITASGELIGVTSITATGLISASGDARIGGNVQVGYSTNGDCTDKVVHMYNGAKRSCIFTTSNTGNATTTIRGGNFTHQLLLKDSYTSVNKADCAYAKITGGHVNDACLILFNSSSNTTTKVTTTTSSFAGPVGIGTTTPGKGNSAVKFEVVGSVSASSNIYAKEFVIAAQNANDGITFESDSNKPDIFLSSNVINVGNTVTPRSGIQFNNAITGSHVTMTGTISAEQLTTTDDLTVGDDINLSSGGFIYLDGAGGGESIRSSGTTLLLTGGSGIRLNSNQVRITDSTNPTLALEHQAGSVSAGDIIGNIYFQTDDANDIKSFELQVKATANHDDGADASAEAIFRLADADTETEVVRLTAGLAKVTGDISGSSRAIIGLCNSSIGTYSSVLGGRQNVIANGANCSVIAGGYFNNICSGDSCSFIGGGQNNRLDNDFSVIVGGFQNCNDAICSIIGGGKQNYIASAATCSAIFGGLVNSILDGRANYVGGGCGNKISNGDCNTVGGGSCNKICVQDGKNKNIVAGGGANAICCNVHNSTIAGGASNLIERLGGDDYGSTIAGGALNQIVGGDTNTIGGGCCNLISGSSDSVIAGGLRNTGSAADCAGILAGLSNTVTHDKAMIVGSDITSLGACVTHVNNLTYYAHCNNTSYLGTANVAGEIIYAGTSTVSAGDVYILAEPSSGTSGWLQADADTESTSKGMLAIALGSGNSAEVGMLVRGFARFTSAFSLTGASMGSPVYLSTTAGDITLTAPSGTGDIVRIIGHVIDDATETIYFNPDNSYIEIA